MPAKALLFSLPRKVVAVIERHITAVKIQRQAVLAGDVVIGFRVQSQQRAATTEILSFGQSLRGPHRFPDQAHEYVGVNPLLHRPLRGGFAPIAGAESASLQGLPFSRTAVCQYKMFLKEGSGFRTSLCFRPKVPDHSGGAQQPRRWPSSL